MKILLLSCSTGEGHNHCAMAVGEALQSLGHTADFLDMLHLCGEPGPLSFDKVLNRISAKAPDVFGMMYHAGAMYSATRVTSPIYLANIRHARELKDYMQNHGYEAVVCSHLFPMETLTYLRRNEKESIPCYGILSDYTCIPFLPETELDDYFLPHEEVRAACVAAGMPKEKLYVTGMPVSSRFCTVLSKEEARKALNLPLNKRIYLVMTGGIGCGDALNLCRSIRRIPDKTPCSACSPAGMKSCARPLCKHSRRRKCAACPLRIRCPPICGHRMCCFPRQAVFPARKRQCWGSLWYIPWLSRG